MLRLATPDDAPALAEMLARSFHDDPVSVWAHPHAGKRARRIARFFAGRLTTLVPHELTWTTAERDAAALWAPPDAWAVPPGELLEPGGAEREIRACAVHACELIAAELGVAPRVLDTWLWNRGQEPRYKALRRHRCRTVYY